VNRLNEWLDSRFIDTRVFADPTEEEMQRPQLWRLWRSLPPRGRAAFFVGGLMRAANQRAEGEIGEPEFSGWLRHLSQMQAALVADGALILKFFLHTPAKVQKKKLKRGRETPRTRLAGGPSRLGRVGHPRPGVADRRAHPPETSGPGAPWTIVEATDDRYRDLTVARTILAALTARLSDEPRTPRRPSPNRPSATSTKAPTCCRASTCRSRWTATSTASSLPNSRPGCAGCRLRPATGVSTVLAFEGWDAAGKGDPR
jgi:polyphosphate kinase 2 (PPK2 family)